MLAKWFSGYANRGQNVNFGDIPEVLGFNFDFCPFSATRVRFILAAFFTSNDSVLRQFILFLLNYFILQNKCDLV
jgi:hypothetical protein